MAISDDRTWTSFYQGAAVFDHSWGGKGVCTHQASSSHDPTARVVDGMLIRSTLARTDSSLSWPDQQDMTPWNYVTVPPGFSSDVINDIRLWVPGSGDDGNKQGVTYRQRQTARRGHPYQARYGPVSPARAAAVPIPAGFGHPAGAAAIAESESDANPRVIVPPDDPSATALADIGIYLARDMHLIMPGGPIIHDRVYTDPLRPSRIIEAETVTMLSDTDRTGSYWTYDVQENPGAAPIRLTTPGEPDRTRTMNLYDNGVVVSSATWYEYDIAVPSYIGWKFVFSGTGERFAGLASLAYPDLRVESRYVSDAGKYLTVNRIDDGKLCTVPNRAGVPAIDGSGYHPYYVWLGSLA